jgi:hypothetical protein
MLILKINFKKLKIFKKKKTNIYKMNTEFTREVQLGIRRIEKNSR